MREANIISIKACVIAIVLVICMMLLVPSAHADIASTGVAAFMCQQVTGTAPASAYPPGAFTTQIGGQTGLILISFALMLAMSAIAALLFAIGYAFNLNSLKRFGKTEFGEIAITVLIIAVLVGSSSAITALFHNNNIFYVDCVQLGGFSISSILPIAAYGVASDVVNAISSAYVRVGTESWGISMIPFSGYSVVQQQISLLTGIGGGIILLLLAVIVMLGIIYFLFPLFLYVGIVLRTIPITRAAGGSFIALYIGFYLVFPLLLGVMLHYVPSVPVTLPTGNVLCTGGVGSGGTSSCFFDFGSFVNSIYNTGTGIGTLPSILSSLLFYDVAATFITTVIAPSAYTVLAVVLSLYVSLEVVEIMSGLLGAPSLSSHGTLKKLI